MAPPAAPRPASALAARRPPASKRASSAAGLSEEKREMLLRMLSRGVPVTQVAEIGNLTEAAVAELASSAAEAAGTAAAAARAAVLAAHQQQQQAREEDDAAFGGITPAEAQAIAHEEAVRVQISRVQAHIFRRRVRTLDFFTHFDPLHSGRCTRTQFKRALLSIVHPVGFDALELPIDADLLADHFAPAWAKVHEPQVVDYTEFCLAMDSVFNTHFLEKRPNTYVPRPGATVPHQGFEPPHDEEDRRVQHVMARIANLVRIRGIILVNCLDEVQRCGCDVRSGRIEPQAFVEHFPLAKSTATQPAAIDAEDMRIVAARYTDEQGFVRLHAFQRDIQDMLGEGPSEYRPTSFSSGRPLGMRRLFHTEESPGFPLQKMPKRPHSARAGGAGGSGSSAGPSPMESSRFVPSAPLSARPAGSRPRPATAGTMRFDGVLTTPRGPAPKEDLLTRLRKAASDLKLHVYQPFRDADTMRRGLCTVSQARTALTVLKLEVDAADMAELARRYCTADGSFCYPAFARDVNPNSGQPPPCEHPEAASVAFVPGASLAGGTGAVAARALGATAGGGAGMGVHWEADLGEEMPSLEEQEEEENPASEEDEEERARREHQLHDLLTKIAKRVRNAGMELMHVFSSFANSRWAKPGNVTKNQFARAVDMLGFQMDDRERTLLFRAYCNPEQSEFNFLDFCSDVDPTRVARPNSGKDAAKRVIQRYQQPRYSKPYSAYYDRAGRLRPLNKTRPISAPCHGATRCRGVLPQPVTTIIGPTG